MPSILIAVSLPDTNPAISFAPLIVNSCWCLVMLNAQSTSISFRKLLLWTLAAPTVVALTFALENNRLVRAQAEALEGVEIPTTLPDGTTVNINSSEAMRPVTDALRSRFTQQYDGTQVEVNYQNADESIQALLNGESDLAAIGRGLTEAEAQQGLEQVALTRPKIAIITSPENPFGGSITVEQFAQIFRGEITNWSEIGGADAPIVVVDRPAVSDTRQAFQNYPVFQNAPFEAAADAIALDEDSTQAVIAELGPNSISYAVAEQVLDDPAVKIVPMHDTLPDDPRYPFSQPLSYVYQGDNPSPAALAFLGYATNPDNEAVIAAARAGTATAEESEPLPAEASAPEEEPAVDEAAPEEEPAAVEDPVAESETVIEETESATAATGRTSGVPWWPWLLALPVLGGLLWWLLKDRTPVAAPVAAPEPERRIILTPRNCQDAYAYWELPQSEVDALKRQGCSLALRLHDVTDIADIAHQPPHSMKQFDCETVAQGDRHLPISFDDRDYLVELGYLDKQDDWHALVRSAGVRVPACPSTVPNRAAGIGAAAGAAGLTVAGAAAVAKTRPVASPTVTPVTPEPARIVLTPRDCRHAYAYWELPEGQMQQLKTNQDPLRLRLYDVTELPNPQGSNLSSMQEFDCEITSPGDHHLPIAIDNRDYLVELGYFGPQREWIPLAKSDSVRVPACKTTTQPPIDRANWGAAAAAAAGVSGRGGVATPKTPGLVNNLQNNAKNLTDSVKSKGADITDRTADTVDGLGKAASGLAGAATAGGAATVAGAKAVARSPLEHTSDPGDQTQGAGIRSDLGAESHIILVPRTADSAYAYWEIAPAHRQELKARGGRTLALRIHDATNLELDYQPPHGTQEYLCQETDQDKHVKVPTPDRDYVAELGYLTAGGDWLQLIRSLHVRIG